jgi:hypothetical protein
MDEDLPSNGTMPLLVNTASTKADISVRYAAILVSGRGTR